MPTHDIIDNRTERLVDHINRMLDTTETARFAVGYFFLSGLESIADRLEGVKELRLLIGNTTNRETIEQIAEGYKRLELVQNAIETQSYPSRTEASRMVDETVTNIRSVVEHMEQTDQGECLVKTLVRMISEKRLKVRVYTRGRLHAKAYIFDYYNTLFDRVGRPIERHEKGIAIIGSSNLTLSGIRHNTELNVVVQGNDNHAELVRWFDELWDEAEDFDEKLMQEMQRSWAIAPVRPYDIYMKTLYTLVKDRLEGEDTKDILWDDEITSRLADFQKVAVRQAIQIIRDFGGVFVADVVGLGKSYIGTAIAKHFERTEHARPLIICPAPLVEMWERANEVYQLNARVVSMGYLRGDDDGTFNFLLRDPKYRDRDFIVIDESHNLRHPDTQRYKVVQSFLATGRRCCFLTATPRNKSAWDVYHQIKLFHQDDKTNLPIDPPILKDYFRLIEKDERKLPDLLVHILIRRTRNHILRWYGYDAETHEPLEASQFKEYLEGSRQAYVLVGGKHQFFPRRVLDTIEYSIEDTYRGLYRQLRSYIGASHKDRPASLSEEELTYARYGLWHYVVKSKQKQEPYATMQRAGMNLRGLMRILLFKRFESSVYAFRETIRRLIYVHKSFLAALSQGIVPAGEDAQTILYESDYVEEADLLDALRAVSGKYKTDDFDLDRLRQHIEHDIRLLEKILTLVEPITPERDTKLQKLIRCLRERPLSEGKRLIFTQYADTARYLAENLNPGGERKDIAVIYSGDRDKARIVSRFAPKANPEYQFSMGETEIATLIATDVLAEGLNMQDCNAIINYDLHWNPVRLIQRFGRIDRIGSEHEVIYGFNFLPETGIEKNLGLRQKLHNRIQEIHDTIGEDSAILDRTEQLNEEAMYAIYEKNGNQLSLFEDDEEEFLDVNEAEEIMRQLRKENPREYERIASLRDGIRTAKVGQSSGLYVFCQAGRYQQLFLIDKDGEIISRDIPRILGAIRATPEEAGVALPPHYNNVVMRIKRRFAEEVKNRKAEREHTLSLTQSQRYILRELRELFRQVTDEDERAQITVLEKAFRGPITTAINRELNLLRKNHVLQHDLLKSLGQIYFQHDMQHWNGSQQRMDEDDEVKLICSEAFLS
jgi:superfamily II DNA/RNA helicase/nicotinamide mononucleotide adenylyltransferase